MKIIILYISTLLTWVAFDPGAHRRRRGFSYGQNTELFLTEDEQELQQEKKLIRHRLDVIPKRFRGIRSLQRIKFHSATTKSKDPRDSDQRKIRRRFNNM